MTSQVHLTLSSDWTAAVSGLDCGCLWVGLRLSLGWVRVLSVKKLTPSGGVLIVSAAPRSSHILMRDYWPEHAEDQLYETVTLASATSAYYVFAHFWLADGFDYYYPFAIFGTVYEAQDYIAWLSTFNDPDLRLYGFGEYWNLYLRALVFDKVRSDQIDAWLAAR